MKTDELIKALGRLKVQTGSLVCLGCGYEHNCGVHGCAIAREAAVRLSLYEHALKQAAKERDLREAQKVLGELLCAIAGGQAYYTMPESLLYAEQHISKDARTKRKGGS